MRDKPSTPCLASRIAVGVPVTVNRLGLVERAESAVRGYLAEHRVPVRDVRVRLLGESGFRVELDQAALDRVSGPQQSGLLTQVARAGLDGDGYLEPYHSGALSG